LKNQDGKYLVLLRNAKQNAQAGEHWDIPGGRIEKGTTLIENLRREIKEETGLELIEEPKLIATQDIFKPDKHVVRLTYTGKANGEIILSEEHIEYRWVSLDELKKLEPIDKYLKEVLNKVDF
jgi:8-oxo-dGTP diphosphatase